MFAIEIEFSDGISLPEVIFVRRTSAILGTSETAHVFIEAAQPGVTDVRVTRGLGRRFRTEAVRRPTESENVEIPSGMVGEFVGHGDIQFGSVKIHIVALDADSLLEGDEAPDRAAIRVLRNALIFPTPTFPAVAVLGGAPVLLSFSPRLPVTIGRSRNCLVRFDTSDISSEHARIGCEGGKCWVEDLGSTNGTFVDGAKIDGRRALDVDDVVSLGSEVSLAVVYRADDIARLQNKPINNRTGLSPSAAAPSAGVGGSGSFARVIPKGESKAAIHDRQQAKFPILFSRNEHVRPTRFILGTEGKLTVGRDPANDIWINTPHISRCHLQLEWFEDGRIVLVDESSNGTWVDGQKLARGTEVVAEPGVRRLDLGGGVDLYLARSEDEELEIQHDLENRTSISSPGPADLEEPLPRAEEEDSPFAPRTMLATRVELPRIREEDLLAEDETEYEEEEEYSEEYAPTAEPTYRAEEAEQYQLLDGEDEPLGLGSNFSKVVLVLLMVLLALFSGLVFLGFFADKYFY